MSYTHLTTEERYQIRAILRIEFTIREIAVKIYRSPSKVSCELRRNMGQRSYHSAQVEKVACDRARIARTPTQVTERDWTDIAERARRDRSQEQISDRLRRGGCLSIMPEWLYPFIYANKTIGGDLWSYLRCQCKEAEALRPRLSEPEPNTRPLRRFREPSWSRAVG